MEADVQGATLSPIYLIVKIKGDKMQAPCGLGVIRKLWLPGGRVVYEVFYVKYCFMECEENKEAAEGGCEVEMEIKLEHYLWLNLRF
jgi:hypothetical protein